MTNSLTHMHPTIHGRCTRQIPQTIDKFAEVNNFLISLLRFIKSKKVIIRDKFDNVTSYFLTSTITISLINVQVSLKVKFIIMNSIINTNLFATVKL